MSKIFSNEFAEDPKKGPPFSPFVVPKAGDKPWIDPLQSRERAAEFWMDATHH